MKAANSTYFLHVAGQLELLFRTPIAVTYIDTCLLGAAKTFALKQENRLCRQQNAYMNRKIRLGAAKSLP